MKLRPILVLSGAAILFAVLIACGSEHPVDIAAVKAQPQEFVGADTCKQCHLEHYDSWKMTLHSRMLQDAPLAVADAKPAPGGVDFAHTCAVDGTTWRFRVNVLTQLGNIGMGGSGLPSSVAMLNPFYKAPAGVGGVAGGAMLAGGGTLAALGLQRGGWSGH